MQVTLFDDLENGKGLPATITAAGGTVSVNTKRIRGTIAYWYVKAATSTTEFDFKITDSTGRDLREYIDEVDTLRDTEHLPLPAGKYTLTISNSSKADETFTVLLRLKEQA